MVHFAIEKLLAPAEGWRSLVRDLAERWPEAPPTELIFALVSAAHEIERMFAPGSPSRQGAEQGWRMAALLGTDLYAMEVAGLPRARAADLRAYWDIDPYFRDL